MDQVRSRDTIVHILAMLLDLRNMARAEGAIYLAYFIEMAAVEANDILRSTRPLREELFLEPLPQMLPAE